MTAAVSIVLAVLVVFAVAFPFLRRPKPAARLGRRAAETASGLSGFGKELEADFRTGIISEDEYEDLKQSYASSEPLQRKSPAPKGKSESIESDIERRVRELRLKKGGAAPSPAAPASAAQGTKRTEPGASRKTGVCPKCGRPYKQGDRFCTACGTRLAGGGR
jgi:hypothetical protein